MQIEMFVLIHSIFFINSLYFLKLIWCFRILFTAMKRIIKYTIGIFAGFGMLYSCTGKFEDMNTSGIQVNPADLPLSAQCAEPMRYCYPPHQNMFQILDVILRYRRCIAVIL